MTDMPLPEPPDVSSLEPRMMTASELQKLLEEVFDWLHEVDASLEPVRDQKIVQSVRDAANLLLQERRERHADEYGRRGG